MISLRLWRQLNYLCWKHLLIFWQHPVAVVFLSLKCSWNLFISPTQSYNCLPIIFACLLQSTATFLRYGHQLFRPIHMIPAFSQHSYIFKVPTSCIGSDRVHLYCVLCICKYLDVSTVFKKVCWKKGSSFVLPSHWGCYLKKKKLKQVSLIKCISFIHLFSCKT